MNWMAALVMLYVVDWCRYPVSWEYLLGSKMLAIILIAHIGYSQTRTFKYRSIFAFFIVGAWVDFIEYIAGQLVGINQSVFLVSLIIYIPWFIWIWAREYNIPSDKLIPQNVSLLLLRPSGFGVIRSFFGLPVSSLCVVAGGNVWAYRKHSGSFVASVYSEKWLKNHILIDTGIVCNDAILNELRVVVGNRRFPFVKCIYSIRNVLRLLGPRFTPVSVFDYIPGIYMMKFLRGRG